MHSIKNIGVHMIRFYYLMTALRGRVHFSTALFFFMESKHFRFKILGL